MRKFAGMALGLAFCVVGCGQQADPAPETTASAAPSEAVAAGTAPLETPGSTPTPAPVPSGTGSAAAAKPAAAAIPMRIRAIGTEPFWNAEISGDMLTYTTPEDQKGQRAALVRRDVASGAEFSGKLGRAAIHIAVSKRPCSDGMSDRSYRFTVVLTLGSEQRQGCGS